MVQEAIKQRYVGTDSSCIKTPLVKYCDKPNLSYPADVLDAFITKRENGKIKCLSIYKPSADIGNDEEQLNVVKEKDKLSRV